MRLARIMVRRQWNQVAMGAIVVVAALTGGRAGAAPGAAEAVQPAVTKQQYEQIIRKLELESPARRLADLVFAEYAGELRAIVEESDRAAREAGRDKARDALTGRIRATPEQIDQWELGTWEAYGKAWPEADRLFDGLLEDLGSVAPGQQATLGAAARSLRRQIMLQPRQAGSRSSSTYLGEGLDLIALSEQTGGPDAAAAAVIGAPGGIDPAALRAPDVRGILADYELQLDRLLIDTFAPDRAAALERLRAGARKDRAALAAVDAGAVERWRRLHELNSVAAQRIAAALEAAAGVPAADAWRRRVEQAACPWLHADEMVDREYRWMVSHEGLSAEQRELLVQLWADFAAERAAKRQAMITTLVRARLECRAMLRPMGGDARNPDPATQPSQRAIDQAHHQLIALEAGARKKLETVLTEPQRQAMRAELHRRRPSSPGR